MSVKRAQAEIDSREFAEWMVLESIEPWSQYRDDLRIGYLGAIMAGMMGGKRHKPEDFMPNFTEGTEPRTESKPKQDMKAAYKMLCKRFAGRMKNPDGTPWIPD